MSEPFFTVLITYLRAIPFVGAGTHDDGPKRLEVEALRPCERNDNIVYIRIARSSP